MGALGVLGDPRTPAFTHAQVCRQTYLKQDRPRGYISKSPMNQHKQSVFPQESLMLSIFDVALFCLSVYIVHCEGGWKHLLWEGENIFLPIHREGTH